MKTVKADILAHAYLRLLADRGVDYLFSNSGTDFTPIMDGLAKYHDDPEFALQVVLCPHENTAMAMAHGYALLSRTPQAVMVHVNVGTANAGLGIINASRSRIPMLVTAGTSPWFESDLPGSRDNFIQWGQDSFDQAGYFREYLRWDGELRGAAHLETVVDRALAICQSPPAGPVYLALPKEVLCQRIGDFRYEWPSRIRAPGPVEPGSVEEAVEILSKADRPLVVVSELGRFRGGMEALVEFAEAWQVPVTEHVRRYVNFPTLHRLHAGFNPPADRADVIVVVESPVPWLPHRTKTRAKVIQIGVDPLYRDLPLRGFAADVAVAGDPVLALRKLTARADPRKRWLTPESPTVSGSRSLTKRLVSHVLGRIVDEDAMIFNEYNLDPGEISRSKPDGWFENSISSGLGWALGAAMGAKLAEPDRTAIAAVGDGTYIFNTPVSAHHVSASHGIPFLTIVLNDHGWSTIKKAYLSSHPDGWCSRTGRFPLVRFGTDVKFEAIVEACGGAGFRVEKTEDLEPMLRRALAVVREEKRQALVNVLCDSDA